MSRRPPATSGEFLDVPQIPVPARRPLVAKEIIKSDERHLDTAIAASYHAPTGFRERYAIDAIEQIDPHRFDADRDPPTIMESTPFDSSNRKKSSKSDWVFIEELPGLDPEPLHLVEPLLGRAGFPETTALFGLLSMIGDAQVTHSTFPTGWRLGFLTQLILRSIS